MLNARQQKELEFYLTDFGKELNEERRNGTTAQGRNEEKVQWFNGTKAQRHPDLFYYRDSLFSLTINLYLVERFLQTPRDGQLISIMR